MLDRITASFVLSAALALCAQAGELKLLSPTGDVPTLCDGHRAYRAMPRNERVAKFKEDAFRAWMIEVGDKPLPTQLVWSWDGTPAHFTVEVTRAADGRAVFRADTIATNAVVDNLEIACAYQWSVWAQDHGCDAVVARGSFRTQDEAPRLLRVPGIGNVRDLGGRRVANGRRVRQGLIFRSIGLNENAWERTTSPEGEEPVTKEWVLGKTRLDDASKRILRDTFGIRTDIDLRRDDECYGMTGSPLGEDVTWQHLSSSFYAGMQEPWGREQFAKLFRVLLDSAAYPIDIHCIAGQDRTGSVAFMLEALLGCEEEEMWLDWEFSGFYNDDNDWLIHERTLDKFLAAFAEAYPAGTIQQKVEAYVKSLGFMQTEIDAWREFMTEAK